MSSCVRHDVLGAQRCLQANLPLSPAERKQSQLATRSWSSSEVSRPNPSSERTSGASQADSEDTGSPGSTRHSHSLRVLGTLRLAPNSWQGTAHLHSSPECWPLVTPAEDCREMKREGEDGTKIANGALAAFAQSSASLQKGKEGLRQPYPRQGNDPTCSVGILRRKEEGREGR